MIVPTFQATFDYTAQGHNVAALMGLYAQLENSTYDNRSFSPFVVFIAFSIEGYINTLGDRAIPFWSKIERLPWKKKVEVLHISAEHEPDWGSEPLRFATEVFDLRNKLAHGRPEKIRGPETTNRTEAEQLLMSGELQPEWQKTITETWVLDAKNRFLILMVYLGDLFGYGESDHLRQSSGIVLIDRAGNT